jgi:hypothetical protein
MASNSAHIHPQWDSPLFLIPGELRNEIYKFALQAPAAITNPSFKKAQATSGNPRFSSLGISLLQTCRRINAEIDFRYLYSENVFRFTDRHRANQFFRRLPKQHRNLVTDVEIDLREIDYGCPSVARDICQYLLWSDSSWANSFGSLRCDAPCLDTLRINAQSWPNINEDPIEIWWTIEAMLKHVKDLHHVAITGSSKGEAMSRRSPWDSVHFVGYECGAKDTALVHWMLGCLKSSEQIKRKYVIWTRCDGMITLEVATDEHVRSRRTRPLRNSSTEGTAAKFPRNGYCTVEQFLEDTLEHNSEDAIKAAD